MNATGTANSATMDAAHERVSGSGKDAVHGSTMAPGYDNAASASEQDANGNGAGAADDPVAGWEQILTALTPAGDDATRIDQIRALETIKSGCAAAQARITATFAASQRRDAGPAPGPAADADSDALRAGTTGRTSGQQAKQRRAKARRLADRSAASQVALARRESPQRGGRFVGLADTLVNEMPHTLAALQAGVLNEWRATIIVRETACLTAEQRTAVDAEIAGKLDGLGDARLTGLVKSIAYRLDPHAATRRAVRAASDRRVTLRPAADAMAYLTYLLPIASATASFAQVKKDVAARPGGDDRTLQQRMADEAVARLTGMAGVNVAEGARPRQATQNDDRGDIGPAEPCPSDPFPSGFSSADSCPGSTDSDGTDTDGTDTDGTDTGGRCPDSEDISAAGQTPANRAADQTPDGSATGTVDDPVAAIRAAYQQAVDNDAGHHGHPTERHSATAGPVGSDAVPAASGAFGAGNADGGPVDTGSTGDSTETGGSGDQAFPPGTDVVINLVMTDRALFADGDDPALLPGNLPLPAPLARAMVRDLPAHAKTWVHRLYTRPDTGELAAMDSRQREFPAGLRHLLSVRDHDTCRTPWCNAPARHIDHLTPAARGGPTSFDNGQSLSEDCNYTRTAPGWSARRDPDRPGEISITTPTGHRYRSPCPDLIPGHTRDTDRAG